MTDQPNTTPHPCEAVEISQDACASLHSHRTIIRLRVALHAKDAECERLLQHNALVENQLQEANAEVDRLKASGWRDADNPPDTDRDVEVCDINLGERDFGFFDQEGGGWHLRSNMFYKPTHWREVLPIPVLSKETSDDE